ncbi:MAG: NADH-quinone oxidoreductase subunit H, partial [Steroidobacteraceae bacterium]
MAGSLLLNALQVLTVLLLAPLFKGVIAWLEETIQGKAATSPLQPYYDLSKLLRKGRVVSSEATWIFHVAPYISFAVPIAVTLLIPALTSFPLFFAFAGDMVGAGFILGLGG